ncbi:MAG TPA: hypothetical protein PKU97_20665, partial [Kofleriaceae bacterium]|nr:hypothetical protein [Kofleriaceae bacterium]
TFVVAARVVGQGDLRAVPAGARVAARDAEVEAEADVVGAASAATICCRTMTSRGPWPIVAA